LHLSAAPDRYYIYCGDSQQDEPGFAWVNARGGFSIRVGRAKQTQAKVNLADPFALRAFLLKLIEGR